MAHTRNSDGLWVAYGLDQVDVAAGGEVDVAGELHTNEYLLEVGSTLSGTTSEYILGGRPNGQPLIPANAIIVSATLYVLTAFDSAGEAATLSIGLIQEDGSTAIDADGIDATIAETAIDAVGDTIACDGALVGVSIGSANGYVTVTEGTEAFTAGKARLIVKYLKTA